MRKQLKLKEQEVFIVGGNKEYSLVGLLRLAAELGVPEKKLHKKAIYAKKVLTKVG